MPRKSSEVARLVTLHHRRRGWAWVATGSAIGLAVYAGLFENLTGVAATLSVIAVFVLVALVLAGVAVVIADTVRIHRADAAVQVSAKGSVSHHPLYAHAHRYPPHHRGSWVFVIFMLVALTGITVGLLPADVNAWGYVTGAEQHDTFNPTSYFQSCRYGSRGVGCHMVTEGYLSSSGAQVTWGSQVPLGQPFGVRDPLWDWGGGRNLINGDTAAIGTILAGLFFEGVTLLLLYTLVVLVRHRRTSPGPVRAASGGVRRTQQPHRGHHGSGARRPARRRR
jgi:hypothetical protein